MQVAEVLTYDKYWKDPRFQVKRPNLHGSLKQAYGDNIYHRRARDGAWLQEDSHHSHPDGTPNKNNIRHDTQADSVLIGHRFTYWGGSAPKIPVRFRHAEGTNVCAHRGHKSEFSERFVASLVAWIESLEQGFVAEPAEWN
jgi:hypothetical protein